MLVSPTAEEETDSFRTEEQSAAKTLRLQWQQAFQPSEEGHSHPDHLGCRGPGPGEG